MMLEKAHMLRCASSFPGLRRGRLAACEKVGRISHDSRALPLNFLKRHSAPRIWDTFERYALDVYGYVLEKGNYFHGF